MKVRITARPPEVAAFVDLLGTIVRVDRVSKTYPHGGGLVRRYVDVTLHGEAEDPDRYAVRCSWCRLPHIVDEHGPAMGGMSWSCRRCGRMFVAADAGIYLAEAVDPATLQVGDWAYLPAGWRQVFDVEVTGEFVRVRTGRANDPLTGFKIRRVVVRREVKPWHDGPTFPNTVYVVRDGQQAVMDE